jgi:hypothetical protein
MSDKRHEDGLRGECRISAPAELCDRSCAPHTMRISVSSPHDVWFVGVGDIAVTSVHATILKADRHLRRDLTQPTSPAYRTSGARSPVFLLRACGMAQWEKLRHRNIDSDRGHTCRGCGAPTTGKIEGRARRRTFIALAGSPGPALLVRSSAQHRPRLHARS